MYLKIFDLNKNCFKLRHLSPTSVDRFLTCLDATDVLLKSFVEGNGGKHKPHPKINV